MGYLHDNGWDIYAQEQPPAAIAQATEVNSLKTHCWWWRPVN